MCDKLIKNTLEWDISPKMITAKQGVQFFAKLSSTDLSKPGRWSILRWGFCSYIVIFIGQKLRDHPLGRLCYSPYEVSTCLLFLREFHQIVHQYWALVLATAARSVLLTCHHVHRFVGWSTVHYLRRRFGVLSWVCCLLVQCNVLWSKLFVALGEPVSDVNASYCFPCSCRKGVEIHILVLIV